MMPTFRRNLPTITLAAAMVGAPPATFAASDPVPTAWQLLDDGDPIPWWAFPMVYDTVRLRAVLIESGMDSADVVAASLHWELVDSDWVRIYPDGPTPGLVGGTCMAWDVARARAVLFGGGVGDDETWEFDGDSWSERTTTTSPPPRYQCSMTYDEANQRIVLFGGQDPLTGQSFSDTWEYDGTDWTRIMPMTSPPKRGWAGFTYDASRERSVLFGGLDSQIHKADLWEYDGRRKRWTQKTPSPAPSARSLPGMAYDRVRERIVLFGGRGFFGELDDTWEWDGQSWTERIPPMVPSARYGFRMVWDVARQKVLGWGGSLEYGDFNDTWEWDGMTWTRAAVSDLPQVRDSPSMQYHTGLDVVVLYGGVASLPYSGAPIWDTWHWTPAGWVPQADAGTPTSARGFPLAYDEDTGRLIGFGGAGASGLPEAADVHEYGGNPPSWLSSPRHGPDPRVNHAWAHAPSLGGAILYGGYACCIAGSRYVAEDTWQLGEVGWERLYPPVTPGKRQYSGMAFDALRGYVLMYGGDTDPGTQDDTWRFDGATWERVCDGCAPGTRSGANLVYDFARNIAVLFGDGAVDEGVTWEFDGSSWAARSTPWQPDPSRCYAPLAYDSNREIVLLFGGGACIGSGNRRNDTWAYGTDPDGDGVVGGLDNCREVPNPDQANFDGDPAGDLCDCAVSDATAWGAPRPVAGVTLAGSGTTTITWEDQAAVVGTGVRYDLVSGDLAELRSGGWAGTSCIASETADPSASDSRTLDPETGFWYLVRSRNGCAIGTYDSAGLDAASPCP